MKRALLVLALLAMAGVWPSGAHAWQWKRTTVVFDTTTSVGPAATFTTSAISTAGASMVVLRIFSSDTCEFCGDSSGTTRFMQGSHDGTNWAVAGVGSPTHGVTLSSDITATSSLKRSSSGGGRHYILVPTVNSTTAAPGFIAWPFIRLNLVSTNHAGYTNRYRIEATVYTDQ